VYILEVSQGATIFQEGIDWQQSGNHVDWIGSGNEPAIGTTYTVRRTYTKQMIKGEDYVDGGWFGITAHPTAGTYHYVVTAFDGSGETAFNSGSVLSRMTLAEEMNRLSWLPVNGANGYRVYRATTNGSRTDFQCIKELGSEAVSDIDDAVDEPIASNLPAGSSAVVSMSTTQIELGNLNVVNFGRGALGDEPVNGSNCSIDYDYYLGRKDIIYATTRGPLPSSRGTSHCRCVTAANTGRCSTPRNRNISKPLWMTCVAGANWKFRRSPC